MEKSIVLLRHLGPPVDLLEGWEVLGLAADALQESIQSLLVLYFFNLLHSLSLGIDFVGNSLSTCW